MLIECNMLDKKSVFGFLQMPKLPEDKILRFQYMIQFSGALELNPRLTLWQTPLLFFLGRFKTLNNMNKVTSK